MKLSYTKKELKDSGWATVGGRIEDYAAIIMEKGPLLGAGVAYNTIKEHYGDDLVDDVYRGLVVYIGWGTDAYYEMKSL